MVHAGERFIEQQYARVRGQSDGDAIKAQLANGVTVSMQGGQVLDTTLDSQIVIHEYGHGVSTRLTGGPSTVLGMEQWQTIYVRNC